MFESPIFWICSVIYNKIKGGSRDNVEIEWCEYFDLLHVRPKLFNMIPIYLCCAVKSHLIIFLQSCYTRCAFTGISGCLFLLLLEFRKHVLNWRKECNTIHKVLFINLIFHVQFRRAETNKPRPRMRTRWPAPLQWWSGCTPALCILLSAGIPGETKDRQVHHYYVIFIMYYLFLLT